MLGQVAEDLRKHRHWLGLNDIQTSDRLDDTKDVEVKLLDYACGPGSVSYVSTRFWVFTCSCFECVGKLLTIVQGTGALHHC